MQELENNSLCINIKEENEQEKISEKGKIEKGKICLNVVDVDNKIEKFGSESKRKYIPTDSIINENESKGIIKPKIRLKNEIFTENIKSFLNPKSNIINNGNDVNQNRMQTEENINNNNINKLLYQKHNFKNYLKNSKSNRNYTINLRNKRNYSNNIFNNNKRNKSFQERINNGLDNETKTIPGNLFYNKNIGISASNQQIQQKQNINRYNLFHKTLLKNMNLKSPSKNIILNKFKNNNQMNSISLLPQKIIKEDTKEKNDKLILILKLIII